MTAMTTIAPGVNSGDTLLYGVEVKFYSMKLKLTPALEMTILLCLLCLATLLLVANRDKSLRIQMRAEERQCHQIDASGSVPSPTRRRLDGQLQLVFESYLLSSQSHG